MGGVIVDDGVNRLSSGNLLLDDIEEANELLMAMALMGKFKRSSQHDLCWLIGETGQAPLRVFSNQASFGAAS